MRRFTILMTFLLIVCTQLLNAQSVQIKGKVTSSEDGSSLPGASVVVKGTNIATITDAEGNYTLNSPSSAGSLIVSFIGMTTQEVTIGGQTKIDISLKSEVKNLEEVVVTALGITRSERSVGYTVTSVNSEEVKQKSEPDALRSLEGKVPGVDITSTSGAPGSATRVNIRGISSMFGSNEPLYIVDGTPYSNDYIETNSAQTGGGGYLSGLSSLDPNDIESISVLKGAAASALYGSRAASGVIMITTKSGSSKKANNGLEVSLNSSISFEQVAGLPDYQNIYGAGSEFNFANANGSWGPKFTPGTKIPIWGPYQGLPGMPDSIPYQAYPNNVKDLFKIGVIYDNSINIRSSNDKSVFNLTASDLHQTGYIPNSSFLRQGISAGGSTNLDHGFSFNGNVSYSHNEQDGSFYGDNQVGSTSSSFARTLFLNRAWNMGLPYTNPITGASLFPVGAQADNPLWAWQNNPITTKTDRIVANAGTTLKIGNSLEFKYQIGINTYNLSRLQVNNIGSRAYGGVGYITQENSRTEEIESNFFATYNKKLFNDFALKLLIGQSTHQNLFQDLIMNGQTMIVPGVFTLDNTNSISSGGTTYSENRMFSVFGDAELSYKDYLFLTVTARNDWSSTLPVDKRSYIYPSVSGSYLFSDALHLNNDVFSLGKLRLSWSKVGKDAMPYAYNGKYYPITVTNVFPFNSQLGMLDSNTAYSNLTPEFTTETEVGTQLNFFKNRIGFDFTYYYKDSKNQIAQVPAAASTGFSYVYTNLGELTNKGAEISLRLVPIKMVNSFTWDISFIYTKNKNEVVSLEPGVKKLDIANQLTANNLAVIAEPGHPYGVFLGTVAARDSKGNLLIDPSTGTMIPAADPQIIGDPNPKYNLGISNEFNFKGIHLSFLFDFKIGGDIYSTTIQDELGRGVTKDTKDREGSYIVPGVYGDPNTGKALVDKNGNEIVNTRQVAANEIYFGTGSFATNGPDEFSVYDGTYYRLRELSLGYTFPKKLYSKWPISSATLNFTGRNLWYFCPNVPKYTNFDTEVSAFGTGNVQGIEYSSAPSVRRYGISLNITF